MPGGGYREDKQSVIAKAYFAFLNCKRSSYGIDPIRYSENSIFGEFKWSNYKVDGYTPDCLYEIHG